MKYSLRNDASLEAALNVSEYTGNEDIRGRRSGTVGLILCQDNVDIISYTNKSKRIVTQIKDLCSIISGLLAAGDYKLGNELFANNNVKQNEAFFQKVFEVGRRYY